MTDPLPEMVERVARAICAANALSPRWELCSTAQREDHVRFARAAIEAMREPTAHMLAVVAPDTEPATEADYALALRAVELLPPSEHPDVGDILAEIARDWRHMTEAALAEEHA